LCWELVRLSAQGDFGVPARILADGRFSMPVAFVDGRGTIFCM